MRRLTKLQESLHEKGAIAESRRVKAASLTEAAITMPASVSDSPFSVTTNT